LNPEIIYCIRKLTRSSIIHVPLEGVTFMMKALAFYALNMSITVVNISLMIEVATFDIKNDASASSNSI